MPEATVAVLGTGRMGGAMAERLAGQGVAVVVYNRSPERAAALAERIGATVAASPAEAAAAADVTISMVADDEAVRALFDGPDGVAGRHPARGGGGRHEHGPARHDPVRRRCRPGARAPASSTRRCRAASGRRSAGS